MARNEVMNAAEAAKDLMLSDRFAGEMEFLRLFKRNRGDGMIHYQRGLAYESLNELKLAAKDFSAAADRFPKTEWKGFAREALMRVTRLWRRGGAPSKKSKRSNRAQTQNSRKVWVIHGRDERLRQGMFTFLRSLNLEPLEFAEARALTKKSSPYVGEILDAAFRRARAVIVMLTPDDEARLRSDLQGPADSHQEKLFAGQARPNVLFEAGMAFASHQDRTILVQFGELRPFSDIAGRHTVNMDGSTAKRQELARRLENCKCPVNWKGIDWHTAGDLIPSKLLSNALPSESLAIEAGQSDNDQAIKKLIHEALQHPKFKWRTPARLAAAAAIPEQQAIALLREDPDVRFSRNKKRETIVGLRSRVGN